MSRFIEVVAQHNNSVNQKMVTLEPPTDEGGSLIEASSPPLKPANFHG